MDTDSPPPAASRRDIQGLRALAVLAVIGAHAAGWPAGGVLGVDVFFVISGFLITGMLLREARGSGRIRLAGFYARRARRLLPPALVVLIAVATAGWFLFNRTRGEQTLWDAAWAAALASNWNRRAGHRLLHRHRRRLAAAALLVAPVEEQFHLVWPVLLLLPLGVAGRRRIRLVAGAVAFAVVAASFAWALVQTDTQATVAYFSTLTRAWELGDGAPRVKNS